MSVAIDYDTVLTPNLPGPAGRLIFFSAVGWNF